MTFRTLTRTLFGAALAMTLAGCVDVAVDVELDSLATATATLTQVMTSDFYAMKGMSAEEAEAMPADAFCSEGELTENNDGSATCTIVEQGAFADLDLGQDQGGVTFTPAGTGLVRIALATADLQAEIGEGEPLDAEMQQLVEAFFTGRTFTLRFAGEEVTDTNMELSEDGSSAGQTISLVDLVNGEADLPDEFYAVVRAP